MKDRASSTTPNQRRAGSTAPGTSTVTLSMPAFVQDKKKLTLVAGGLAALVLVLGVLVATKKSANTEVAAATPPVVVAQKPAAAPPTPPVEAPKPADTAKSPESKVLEPAPTPAMIPPAAPVVDPSKDAARDVKREGEKAAKDKAAAESKGETKGESKGESQKPALPPATLVFAINPWGEIFVNGKSRGVSPPMKSLKLEPGKYRIEIRNTTFPSHAENLDLRARDEITVRHKFQ
jgi:type IV secretory pathway VirB10-like protein